MYGIHSRARHIVSETQRLSHASFQNRNVSTVITAQKATDINAANIASANRRAGGQDAAAAR